MFSVLLPSRIDLKQILEKKFILTLGHQYRKYSFSEFKNLMKIEDAFKSNEGQHSSEGTDINAPLLTVNILRQYIRIMQKQTKKDRINPFSSKFLASLLHMLPYLYQRRIELRLFLR